jgi:hypothetical protein
MAKFDAYAKRKLETAEDEFNSEEIVENITTYLKDSEILADLACFSKIYFSKQELAPIENQLQTKSFNKFTQQFINNKLLTPTKKEMILNKLQEFIAEYPLRNQAKQAYAIYLTLGKSIPWKKHPFIKRLLINSHLETRVNNIKLSNIKNN